MRNGCATRSIAHGAIAVNTLLAGCFPRVATKCVANTFV